MIGNERGTASLEMLLVLPTLLVFLVLLTDLGYGWVVKIRAEVATRYVGTVYMRTPRGTDSRELAWQALQDHYAGLELHKPEIVRRKKASGGTSIEGPSHWSSITSALTPWLPRLSSSRPVSLRVERRPPFGTILPSSPVFGVFVIDKNPWSYDRIPLSPSALVDRAIGLDPTDQTAAAGIVPAPILATLEIVAILLGVPFKWIFQLLGIYP